MKRSVPKAFRGSIVETIDTKKFLKELEKYFTRNEKAKIGHTLSKLINMRSGGKRNIREYIIEMSNLARKLKGLMLELFDDLLVHLVFISLFAQYGQFVVSYNTQKDKWTLNELVARCVQEEERLQ
ncbi:uncharacterized protein LOC133313436 [Gastrolobium bilobum]|uniref:uncharacterized protein LOC133313436 n=1 Tax=Gastrolobium bilobum TaxID=150636 RepID=UPI002AAF8990|nr:uncharacterized protein LOC133313436 [Gastrolobium bilobum]